LLRAATGQFRSLRPTKRREYVMRSRTDRRKVVEALNGYLFISPWLIIFIIFSLISLGYAVYLSFTEYNLLRPPRWWGLEGVSAGAGR